MPRASPFAIVLSKEERVALQGQVRQYTSSYCVFRRIVCSPRKVFPTNYRCSPGHAAPDCQQVAQAIRRRATSWPGLATSGRASRPRFPPASSSKLRRSHVNSRIACSQRSRDFSSEIRREVITQGLLAEIGGATLWRWLSADALRPWRYRSWISPSDPDFAAEAGRILDLYDRVWQGRTLLAKIENKG